MSKAKFQSKVEHLQKEIQRQENIYPGNTSKATIMGLVNAIAELQVQVEELTGENKKPKLGKEIKKDE